MEFTIRKAEALGWFGRASGHDFRKMGSIVEKRVSLHAERMKKTSC